MDRGRGRGRDMVMPAWMTSNKSSDDISPRSNSGRTQGYNQIKRSMSNNYDGRRYEDDSRRRSDESYSRRQDQGNSQDNIGSRIGRWIVCLDTGSGFIYYWDPITRESRWDRPRSPPPPPNNPPRPLPSQRWVEVYDDRECRHYYWNESTDEVTWTMP